MPYDQSVKVNNKVSSETHASQNIWKAAKKWFDGRTNEAKDWFEEVRKKLCNKEISCITFVNKNKN
jgi:hypothetical protein